MNYPIQIISINKVAEVVALKNVSPEPINLDGWKMCSIKGAQEHVGVGGPIGPGEMREFKYQGAGNIWSNNEHDPGALYNPNGQLVSYWNDPTRP